MTAPEAQPRTIPLRKWLLFGLVFLSHVPFIVMLVFAVAWIREPHDPRNQLAGDVRSSVEQWSDPAWREQLMSRYADHNVALILTEGGVEVYNSSGQSVEDLATGRTVGIDRVVAGDSDPQLVMYVIGDPDDGPPEELPVILIAGGVAFILSMIFLAVYIGRTMVRPLSAASQAARQVAGGDLDVTLPPSRIREVNDLNNAINSMSVDLRESLEQQAALEQERRMMIGAVVHDLRTPLFALRGYLEGLETGVADTPEKQRRYFDSARQKADVLDRLTSDLFNFTRLEYLDETPVREPFDLSELLRSLASGIRPQAEAKGVEVRMNLDQKCLVSGDRYLLTRAIENLLDNAMRHTPAGGLIEVASTSVDGLATFTIADTGSGIPDADLPHLFTPLFRGETSRNRRTGGAGLGLAIARRILRAHGGDLDAGNVPEGGARFTGWLPVGEAPDDISSASGHTSPMS